MPHIQLHYLAETGYSFNCERPVYGPKREDGTTPIEAMVPVGPGDIRAIKVSEHELHQLVALQTNIRALDRLYQEILSRIDERERSDS